MVDFAKGYFRRSIFKTYRFFKHPRKLKTSPIMRWFARHFLDKRVWKPTQHTFAGGMAVGLFVTVQLLPIQMPTAAILAAIFRVNIPIAIALCWLSNPATLAPIGLLENWMGTWIMHKFGDPTAAAAAIVEEHETLARGIQFAKAMFLGGVFLGGALAPVGYILSYFIWGAIDQWNKFRKQPDLPLEKGPEI
ncbi:DUF2062 domain-containing protein [Prosthecobacter algae]|uniref:DUF2062 domain-containing protein n=1 Tax=Prosthecobacter algae TaxID=1144682 RepID=A0ABP9P2F9_9BACT